MRIAALFAFGGLLALTACAQNKKMTSRKTAASGPVITAMRMDRSACFGRCPVYGIEVKADGTARYYGRTYTEHQGIWEKNVGSSKTGELLREFQMARVDTCSGEYRMIIADLPGLYYTFTYSDGKTKQINNASFGPLFLGSLAQRVDETIVVDGGWKKVAESAEQQ